jgi:endoglucanase
MYLKSLILRIKYVTFVLLLALNSYSFANQGELQLNDKNYFSAQGINYLVFSNWYNGLFSDSKMSGVEIIQHGQRTATNGDVRLNSTPEQWDPIPQFIERKVDSKNHSIEAFLRYPQFNFNYSIKAVRKSNSLVISVILPEKLPLKLQGIAGFNMEFLPSVFQQKAFISEQQSAVLGIYPSGPKEQINVMPAPLGSGKQMTLAPEDEEHRVSIESDTLINLYDGRSKAQNGWYVLRSLLPANKTGAVLNWTITANTQPNWLRKPVIAHSQLGYHPQQQKVAVIELDANDTKLQQAILSRVFANGDLTPILRAKPINWGQYQRYHYAKFDFSQITEPGIYVLQYGEIKTAAFRIAEDVYKQAWHPTLDVYFPVQMDHVLVNEAYRVWHGASHLDDALQAPINQEHFDLYAQGSSTDSPYLPGQHVPDLNYGGWYDAGDYDIRTQTQYNTVINLVQVWEKFKLSRDTTLVDYPAKYVDLHVPDGKPDLLQQIEHGALALIGQHRAFGRAINGIIVPDISQYTHLGDGVTMTDNLIYNDQLQNLESNGKQSGKFDDRWVFTSRSSAVNYGSIAALTSASRALKGYNDALSLECAKTAQHAWQEEQSHPPYLFRHGNTTGGPLASEQLKAAVELFLSTKQPQYSEAINLLLPEIEGNFVQYASLAIRVMPFMNAVYQHKIMDLAQKYSESLTKLPSQNPFNVLITDGGWAGNGSVINQAITHYYLYQAFPTLFNKEQVFNGLNYLYGTHPDSDISFVSNVGTVSKKVAYGMNRADYSFISGGIVPGILLLKPDFPENKEDWPFLWGENEYVINLGASYIFLVNAVDELLNKPSN